MNDRTIVSLMVNGSPREALIRTADTLLDTLRSDFALTGAKRGCDQGVCGACTVLVDGRAVRACLSLSVNCADCDITTAEGLAEGIVLDPVQQAFVDAGAVQCGFCMPGMVISAVALLHENPNPSVDQIRHAVSGNICRCSGYVKIIEAIRIAGQV